MDSVKKAISKFNNSIFEGKHIKVDSVIQKV